MRLWACLRLREQPKRARSFRKECGAKSERHAYARRITPRFLSACESLQPAEKACWEILLRERESGEKIPGDVLNTAMDKTLAQLWSLLRAGSVKKWLATSQSLPRLSQAERECALTLLLPYFETGRRALELISKELGELHPDLTAEERARMSHDLHFAFHVLVQCQLQSICGDCKHSGACDYGDRRKAFGVVRRRRKRATTGARSRYRERNG